MGRERGHRFTNERSIDRARESAGAVQARGSSCSASDGVLSQTSQLPTPPSNENPNPAEQNALGSHQLASLQPPECDRQSQMSADRERGSKSSSQCDLHWRRVTRSRSHSLHSDAGSQSEYGAAAEREECSKSPDRCPPLARRPGAEEAEPMIATRQTESRCRRESEQGSRCDLWTRSAASSSIAKCIDGVEGDDEMSGINGVPAQLSLYTDRQRPVCEENGIYAERSAQEQITTRLTSDRHSRRAPPGLALSDSQQSSPELLKLELPYCSATTEQSTNSTAVVDVATEVATSTVKEAASSCNDCLAVALTAGGSGGRRCDCEKPCGHREESGENSTNRVEVVSIAGSSAQLAISCSYPDANIAVSAVISDQLDNADQRSSPMSWSAEVERRRLKPPAIAQQFAADGGAAPHRGCASINQSIPECRPFDASSLQGGAFIRALPAEADDAPETLQQTTAMNSDEFVGNLSVTVVQPSSDIMELDQRTAASEPDVEDLTAGDDRWAVVRQDAADLVGCCSRNLINADGNTTERSCALLQRDSGEHVGATEAVTIHFSNDSQKFLAIKDAPRATMADNCENAMRSSGVTDNGQAVIAAASAFDCTCKEDALPPVLIEVHLVTSCSGASKEQLKLACDITAEEKNVNRLLITQEENVIVPTCNNFIRSDDTDDGLVRQSHSITRAVCSSQDLVTVPTAATAFVDGIREVTPDSSNAKLENKIELSFSTAMVETAAHDKKDEHVVEEAEASFNSLASTLNDATSMSTSEVTLVSASKDAKQHQQQSLPLTTHLLSQQPELLKWAPQLIWTANQSQEDPPLNSVEFQQANIHASLPREFDQNATPNDIGRRQEQPLPPTAFGAADCQVLRARTVGIGSCRGWPSSVAAALDLPLRPLALVASGACLGSAVLGAHAPTTVVVSPAAAAYAWVGEAAFTGSACASATATNDDVAEGAAAGPGQVAEENGSPLHLQEPHHNDRNYFQQHRATEDRNLPPSPLCNSSNTNSVANVVTVGDPPSPCCFATRRPPPQPLRSHLASMSSTDGADSSAHTDASSMSFSQHSTPAAAAAAGLPPERTTAAQPGAAMNTAVGGGCGLPQSAVQPPTAVQPPAMAAVPAISVVAGERSSLMSGYESDSLEGGRPSQITVAANDHQEQPAVPGDLPPPPPPHPPSEARGTDGSVFDSHSGPFDVISSELQPAGAAAKVAAAEKINCAPAANGTYALPLNAAARQTRADGAGGDPTLASAAASRAAPVLGSPAPPIAAATTAQPPVGTAGIGVSAAGHTPPVPAVLLAAAPTTATACNAAAINLGQPTGPAAAGGAAAPAALLSSSQFTDGSSLLDTSSYDVQPPTMTATVAPVSTAPATRGGAYPASVQPTGVLAGSSRFDGSAGSFDASSRELQRMAPTVVGTAPVTKAIAPPASPLTVVAAGANGAVPPSSAPPEAAGSSADSDWVGSRSSALDVSSYAINQGRAPSTAAALKDQLAAAIAAAAATALPFPNLVQTLPAQQQQPSPQPPRRAQPQNAYNAIPLDGASNQPAANSVQPQQQQQQQQQQRRADDASNASRGRGGFPSSQAPSLAHGALPLNGVLGSLSALSWLVGESASGSGSTTADSDEWPQLDDSLRSSPESAGAAAAPAPAPAAAPGLGQAASAADNRAVQPATPPAAVGFAGPETAVAQCLKRADYVGQQSVGLADNRIFYPVAGMKATAEPLTTALLAQPPQMPGTAMFAASVDACGRRTEQLPQPPSWLASAAAGASATTDDGRAGRVTWATLSPAAQPGQGGVEVGGRDRAQVGNTNPANNVVIGLECVTPIFIVGAASPSPSRHQGETRHHDATQRSQLVSIPPPVLPPQSTGASYATEHGCVASAVAATDHADSAAAPTTHGNANDSRVVGGGALQPAMSSPASQKSGAAASAALPAHPAAICRRSREAAAAAESPTAALAAAACALAGAAAAASAHGQSERGGSRVIYTAMDAEQVESFGIDQRKEVKTHLVHFEATTGQMVEPATTRNASENNRRHQAASPPDVTEEPRFVARPELHETPAARSPSHKPGEATRGSAVLHVSDSGGRWKRAAPIAPVTFARVTPVTLRSSSDQHVGFALNICTADPRSCDDGVLESTPSGGGLVCGPTSRAPAQRHGATREADCSRATNAQWIEREGARHSPATAVAAHALAGRVSSAAAATCVEQFGAVQIRISDADLSATANATSRAAARENATRRERQPAETEYCQHDRPNGASVDCQVLAVAACNGRAMAAYRQPTVTNDGCSCCGPHTKDLYGALKNTPDGFIESNVEGSCRSAAATATTCQYSPVHSHGAATTKNTGDEHSKTTSRNQVRDQGTEAATPTTTLDIKCHTCGGRDGEVSNVTVHVESGPAAETNGMIPSSASAAISSFDAATKSQAKAPDRARNASIAEGANISVPNISKPAAEAASAVRAVIPNGTLTSHPYRPTACPECCSRPSSVQKAAAVRAAASVTEEQDCAVANVASRQSAAFASTLGGSHTSKASAHTDWSDTVCSATSYVSASAEMANAASNREREERVAADFTQTAFCDVAPTHDNHGTSLPTQHHAPTPPNILPTALGTIHRSAAHAETDTGGPFGTKTSAAASSLGAAWHQSGVEQVIDAYARSHSPSWYREESQHRQDWPSGSRGVTIQQPYDRGQCTAAVRQNDGTSDDVLRHSAATGVRDSRRDARRGRGATVPLSTTMRSPDEYDYDTSARCGVNAGSSRLPPHAQFPHRQWYDNLQLRRSLQWPSSSFPVQEQRERAEANRSDVSYSSGGGSSSSGTGSPWSAPPWEQQRSPSSAAQFRRGQFQAPPGLSGGRYGYRFSAAGLESPWNRLSVPPAGYGNRRNGRRGRRRSRSRSRSKERRQRWRARRRSRSDSLERQDPQQGPWHTKRGSPLADDRERPSANEADVDDETSPSADRLGERLPYQQLSSDIQSVFTHLYPSVATAQPTSDNRKRKYNVDTDNVNTASSDFKVPRIEISERRDHSHDDVRQLAQPQWPPPLAQQNAADLCQNPVPWLASSDLPWCSRDNAGGTSGALHSAAAAVHCQSQQKCSGCQSQSPSTVDDSSAGRMQNTAEDVCAGGYAVDARADDAKLHASFGLCGNNEAHETAVIATASSHCACRVSAESQRSSTERGGQWTDVHVESRSGTRDGGTNLEIRASRCNFTGGSRGTAMHQQQTAPTTGVRAAPSVAESEARQGPTTTALAQAAVGACNAADISASCVVAAEDRIARGASVTQVNVSLRTGAGVGRGSLNETVGADRAAGQCAQRGGPPSFEELRKHPPHLPATDVEAAATLASVPVAGSFASRARQVETQAHGTAASTLGAHHATAAVHMEGSGTAAAASVETAAAATAACATTPTAPSGGVGSSFRGRQVADTSSASAVATRTQPPDERRPSWEQRRSSAIASVAASPAGRPDTAVAHADAVIEEASPGSAGIASAFAAAVAAPLLSPVDWQAPPHVGQQQSHRRAVAWSAHSDAFGQHREDDERRHRPCRRGNDYDDDDTAAPYREAVDGRRSERLALPPAATPARRSARDRSSSPSSCGSLSTAASDDGSDATDGGNELSSSYSDRRGSTERRRQRDAEEAARLEWGLLSRLDYCDPLEQGGALADFLWQFARRRVVVSTVRRRTTKQYFKDGDFSAALADFRCLQPDHVRNVHRIGKTGTVDNKYRVTVRRSSATGTPTIEIRPLHRRVRKHRYHVCYKIRYLGGGGNSGGGTGSNAGGAGGGSR